VNELPVEFARSARRHRIGKAHAMFVVENNSPEIVDEKYGAASMIGDWNSTLLQSSSLTVCWSFM
jgi:hypothetical protein